MTSLQRASRTGKLEAKSGAFQSSFAAGLDLSEFGLPSKRQESAAAELLHVKMEESRQESQEEREERWIQEVAKAKGKELPSVVLEKYGSRWHAAPQASHIHGCVLLSVQTREVYPDRERDYWSGYFMSRIFDKALDRTLERVLFAATSLGATREALQQSRRLRLSVSLNAMMVSRVLPRIMWFVTTRHVFTMLLM